MSNKDEEFFKNLLSIYHVESKERMQDISNQLINLEKTKEHSQQKAILNVIFREVHSLKSASRSVDLSNLENIFRYLEDLYATLIREDIIPSSEHLDILHKVNSSVERIIDSSNSKDESSAEAESVIELFKKLQSLRLMPQDSEIKGLENSHESQIKPVLHKEEDTVRISSKKVNALLANAEEMLTTRLSLMQIINDISAFKNNTKEDLKRWEKIYRDKRFLIDDHDHRQMKRHDEVDSKKRWIEFISWSEDNAKSLESKLDEMVSRLEHELHSFSHCVDNLLDDTKQLLLWPFSSILNVLPRIVRELSHSTGKEIDLIIDGSDVEVDKRILEAMKDVMLHLVRNAIDHGIENPEERKSLNKSAHGTIKILVNQISGNEILIEITDDGAGIDLNALKKTAVKQGHISDATAESLTDAQALNLIYYSGVSTSEILTDLSGRGLGMAIIRDKIDQIGGEISVVSKERVGSTFKIKLPLTLATFKGLLVDANHQQFLIPMASIDHILAVNPKDIKTVENKETILYEGKTLSLVWLSELLGMVRVANNISEQESQFLQVVVISSVDKKVAFVVNSILNEHEILIKNFSNPLFKVKNISAAAIASSGKPIPILNCSDLVKFVHSTSIVHKAESKLDNLKLNNKRVLLVEDSFTTRTLLKNILELSGYHVSAATDGLDAWSILKTNDYSIVVSDVEMPRMNGFQLTQKIRMDKNLNNLPVILITSRESQEDKEKGIDAGANAYLPKSTFDSGRLIEIIKRLQA